MKDIKIVGLGIIAIVLIVLVVLLIEIGTKEPITGTNQSPNVEDKETSMNITNKQNLNYTKKHQNTSLSANSFENNSNVKVYVYKTSENYTKTIYVTNLSTSDKKRYLIEAINNRTKDHTELKIEDDNIHMKVTYPNGKVSEKDYKTVNWNSPNISSQGIENMLDLVFYGDILYFQDLKNIKKYNFTGTRNLKLIKTECSNKTEEVWVSNPYAGSKKYTLYNCTSFYEMNYVGKVNNKIINKSWIMNNSCQLSKPETGCYDLWMYPYSEKIYFAGTENFNGKTVYKIIYEKFVNFSKISVDRFVEIFLIDEKGVLLKKTAKERWITNGVPDEFFITEGEIVLEKEY